MLSRTSYCEMSSKPSIASDKNFPIRFIEKLQDRMIDSDTFTDNVSPMIPVAVTHAYVPSHEDLKIEADDLFYVRVLVTPLNL